MESDATEDVDEQEEFFGSPDPRALPPDEVEWYRTSTISNNLRTVPLTMESMQAAYDQCIISPDRAYARITIPNEELMTKRHFEMIARILCKHYNRDMGTMEDLVTDFAKELMNWNQSFSPGRFTEACLTETSESQ